MGNEGRLAGLIGRVSRRDKDWLHPRITESKATLPVNAGRYNRAVEKLNLLGLPQAVTDEIKTAITAATAIQRDEDDIYWRLALLADGISQERVARLNDLKDSMDVQMEIESPKYELPI